MFQCARSSLFKNLKGVSFEPLWPSLDFMRLADFFLVTSTDFLTRAACAVKSRKRIKILSHFELILSMLLGSQAYILMPLRTQEHLLVSNDCAKFHKNRMDSFD